jgi:hypothetical protein
MCWVTIPQEAAQVMARKNLLLKGVIRLLAAPSHEYFYYQ